MAQRWHVWRAATRPIRTSAAICCRKSTSRCGAVLEGFDGLCSLRTWVYRVAHNAATSYVIRQRRARPQMLVSLDEVEVLSIEGETDRQVALNQLTALIQRLKPVDRQVILAWLDGMDAAEIGELTGLSSGNVATKVHRIKSILARDFQGAPNGRS